MFHIWIAMNEGLQPWFIVALLSSIFYLFIFFIIINFQLITTSCHSSQYYISILSNEENIFYQTYVYVDFHLF